LTRREGSRDRRVIAIHRLEIEQGRSALLPFWTLAGTFSLKTTFALTSDWFGSEFIQLNSFQLGGVVFRLWGTMMRLVLKFAVALALGLLLWGADSKASPSERRIALVIGNANYQAGALPTPANDAGLIAQTLQAAGFDVTGARDLDQDSLRRAFRDFLDKASSGGPETVAFIYLGGYGLQLEGDNFFAPIDAKIVRDSNVAAEAIRLSDYTKPLAALRLRATMVVLDIARANLFARAGTPLTGGLALVEPEQGMLIAFNAAPGTVAPKEAGPYSAYAQALAEMMREGGVRAEDLFSRIRLRVNEMTKGAEVPWNASKLLAPFYFFERAPTAPPPAVSREQASSIRSRPVREFSAQEAYLVAIDRDTLQDYEAFLNAYPGDPMARRVRAIIAARREAITWRRSRNVDTPPAYWSYLRRYPRGAHSDDARRRLAYLSAASQPPPRFTVITYDVPPPPREEVIYVERRVLVFDDPDFGFAPPPPPPIIFLSPRPVYFVDLRPPRPPVHAFVLPVPDYSPVPVWVRPPDDIAPPPSNIIYNNIHNTVVVNNTTNVVTITDQKGQAQTIAPPPPVPASQGAGPTAAPPPSSGADSGIAAGAGGAGGPALLAPSLPPSVATKAALAPNPPPPQVLNVPGATTDIKPTPDASPMDGGSKTAPTQIETPVPITDVKPAPGAAPTTSTAPAATLSTTDDKPAQLPGSKGQPLPPFTSAPTKSSPPPGSAPAASSTDTPNIEPESALPGSNGQPLPVTTPASDVPPHVAKPTSPPRRASAPAPPPEAELPPPAAAPPPPPEAEPTTPPESGDAASPASSDEK
jgi:uncharacterized caspase-like protein